MWLKKKDKVLVLSGKDKGKRGEILRSSGPEKFVVAKLNIVKRHQRPKGAGEAGGIIDKEMPLHQSKLAFVCPQCDSPAKIKVAILENGEKARVCKKCSERID